jgi:uncharacterized membrane protein
MAELVKETVTTTDGSTPVVSSTNSEQASIFQTLEYLVYFFFGVLEVLLVFRLVLRLTGANSSSTFVGLIYSITGLFIAPFQGIFPQATTKGVATTAVFEPAVLVAIVVYAVLAVAIVKLLRIFSGRQEQV